MSVRDVTDANRASLIRTENRVSGGRFLVPIPRVILMSGIPWGCDYRFCFDMRAMVPWNGPQCVISLGHSANGQGAPGLLPATQPPSGAV